MKNADKIVMLAKNLCELMEADDRDFRIGERNGLIWQVEGELKRAIEEYEGK